MQPPLSPARLFILMNEWRVAGSRHDAPNGCLWVTSPRQLATNPVIHIVLLGPKLPTSFSTLISNVGRRLSSGDYRT